MDLIIGIALGAGGMWAWDHFRSLTPKANAQQSVDATLQGLQQVVSQAEQRILGELAKVMPPPAA